MGVQVSFEGVMRRHLVALARGRGSPMEPNQIQAMLSTCDLVR
jgi:hypothetical protein